MPIHHHHHSMAVLGQDTVAAGAAGSIQGQARGEGNIGGLETESRRFISRSQAQAQAQAEDGYHLQADHHRRQARHFRRVQASTSRSSDGDIADTFGSQA